MSDFYDKLVSKYSTDSSPSKGSDFYDRLVNKYSENNEDSLNEPNADEFEKKSNTHELSEIPNLDIDNPLLRGAKVAGKALTRGLGRGIESPADLYNIMKYLAGEEEPEKEKTQEQKEFDLDFPMTNQFNLSNLKKLPYLDPGVAENFGKGYEKLIGEEIVPEGSFEKGASNVIEDVTSLFGPAGVGKLAKPLLGGAAKLAKKGISTATDVAKKIPGSSSVAEFTKKITPSLSQSTKEGVGQAGKKLYDALYGAPSVKRGAIAMATSKASDMALNDLLELGDDHFLKRALKVGLPIVGSHAIDKSSNNLFKKSLTNLVDSERLAISKKAGHTPELSQHLNQEHILTPFLERTAQNIIETPGARDALQKNREANLKDVVKNVGLKDFKRQDPETAIGHIKDAFKQEQLESKIEGKRLLNLALGSPSENSIKMQSANKNPSFKSSKDLSPLELQERITDFLKKAPQNDRAELTRSLFNNDTKQQIQLLDKYMGDNLTKTDYSIKTLSPSGKDETIKVKIDPNQDIRAEHLIPHNTLKEIENLSNQFEALPYSVAKFSKELKQHNGHVPIQRLHEFRIAANQEKIPSLWKAVKSDALDFFDNISEDRKNAYKTYLDYFHERFEGGKKKAADKFNDILDNSTNKKQFEQILKDAFGENLISDRYVNNLSTPHAKKVFRELMGALAFDKKNNAKEAKVNLSTLVHELNDLSETEFSHLGKLYKKANPKAKLSLSDISELIKISETTLTHANHSYHSQGPTGKAYLFNTLPQSAYNINKGLLSGNKTLLKKGLNGAFKLIGPFVIGKLANKNILLNQDMIQWLDQGANLDSKGALKAWIGKGNRLKFYDRTDTLILQNILEKNREK